MDPCGAIDWPWIIKQTHRDTHGQTQGNTHKKKYTAHTDRCAHTRHSAMRETALNIHTNARNSTLNKHNHTNQLHTTRQRRGSSQSMLVVTPAGKLVANLTHEEMCKQGLTFRKKKRKKSNTSTMDRRSIQRNKAVQCVERNRQQMADTLTVTHRVQVDEDTSRKETLHSPQREKSECAVVIYTKLDIQSCTKRNTSACAVVSSLH